MAPAAYVTCQPLNVTTGDPDDIGKDDLNALLYIVVTLLFYSMGIIIGIITYLKREQAEMEEDRMFDMYMQLKREPFNLHKMERVNQMALYLKQLEEQRAAREKIESWKTVEHHQLMPHQSCRHAQQNQRQPFICESCSKNQAKPEIRHSYDGGAPLARQEGDWAENGGGTALLCSLTLGVCEPLLTPDSVKRVAFPDSPQGGRVGQTGIQQCQCGAYKSAFRHSSPAVHYSPSSGTQHNDQALSNETTTSTLQTSPQPHEDNEPPTIYDTGDIELKELRQFKYDEVKAVFQKSSIPEVELDKTCDSQASTAKVGTISSPMGRSLSVAGLPSKYSKLTRQFSHDPDRKSAVSMFLHTPLARGDDSITESNNEETLVSIDDGRYNNAPQSLPMLEASTTSNEQPVTSGFNTCETTAVDICDDIQHHQQQQLRQPQPPEQQQQQQQQQQQLPRQQESPHVEKQMQPPNQEKSQPLKRVLPRPWSQPPSHHPPSQPLQPLPLAAVHRKSQPTARAEQHEQQEQPQQQPQPPPQQHHADVRPKVFLLSNIPKSVSVDEQADVRASSSENLLPRNKRRFHDPVYDSWKQGNSQSVDIPDLMRSGKLDSPGKVKLHDKKGTPRTQPERRGALFFTQKALQHKDLDSPRSGGGRGHSRHAGSLGRQESVDSSNSRTSDLSESLESPLLKRDNDGGNSSNLNNSNPSSPASSGAISPPSKHQRRIPRLARSQTLDTSKLLHK